MKEYDALLDLNREWIFGIKDKEADPTLYQDIYDRAVKGQDLLVLKRVKNYHREYEWS
jgi:polyketide biosynthesis 3-hydroxy-3-methylglutaryl-CoA synthase-like enzyme PksG